MAKGTARFSNRNLKGIDSPFSALECSWRRGLRSIVSLPVRSRFGPTRFFLISLPHVSHTSVSTCTSASSTRRDVFDYLLFLNSSVSVMLPSILWEAWWCVHGKVLVRAGEFVLCGTLLFQVFLVCFKRTPFNGCCARAELHGPRAPPAWWLGSFETERVQGLLLCFFAGCLVVIICWWFCGVSRGYGG